MKDKSWNPKPSKYKPKQELNNPTSSDIISWPYWRSREGLYINRLYCAGTEHSLGIIIAVLSAGADILYAIYLLVGMFIEAAQVKYLAQCLTGDIEPAALLHQVQFPNHNQFAPLKDEVSAGVVLCPPHRRWSILRLISCCSMSLTDVACIPLRWLDPWLRLQLPPKISFFLLTREVPSAGELGMSEKHNRWSYFKGWYCFIVGRHSGLDKCSSSELVTRSTV